MVGTGEPGRHRESRPGDELVALSLLSLLLWVGCAARAPVEAPRPLTFEQKVGWILRFEDERILRQALPPPGPAAIEGASPTAPAIQTPDLVRFLTDADARIRRRAALAVGRVGLRAGVPPLVSTLADPEPEVRQIAAFALGLIRDSSAVEALTAALVDPSPLVKGRAAQALGLIGDRAAATVVAEMVAGQLSWGAGQPDDLPLEVDPNVDALRLGVNALARLGAFEPMAEALLDRSGQPRIPWWPLAHALQQVGDPDSLAALISFARWPAGYGAAFAAQALGGLTDATAVDDLLNLIESDHPLVAVSAVAALGRLGDGRAVSPLLQLLRRSDLSAAVQREAVIALGALRAPEATNILLDLLSHAHSPIRAATLRALAQVSPETFPLVLSGLDPDRDWTVRAALAQVLSALDPQFAAPRLGAMLQDPDQRVVASALGALIRLRPEELTPVLLGHLRADDPGVRAAAARGLGELMPDGAVAALVEAYGRSAADPSPATRAAVLTALGSYQTPEAQTAIETAMADPDWSIRESAAELLSARDPATDYLAAIRPAPTTMLPAAYEEAELVNPTVSPHIYVDTSKGTVQIELAVLDAPLTVRNFIRLAADGFFDGLRIGLGPDFAVQSGDPRSDGLGGPGYTIRDEVNDLAFVRGTVAMIGDRPNAGGSRFRILRAPQPRLDARGTAFGRVVAGWDVLDRLEEGDLIERARVWDGTGELSRFDGLR